MSPLSWWLLAGLLLLAELLTTTFYALLLALAAGVVAIAAHLGLLAWPPQAGLFAAAVLALWLRWGRRRPRLLRGPRTHVNAGAARWLGRELVLPDGIRNGSGQVRIDDSHWQVSGADCPPGTRVRVQALQGNVLRVAPLPSSD